MINLALFIAKIQAYTLINAIAYFFKNLPFIKNKMSAEYRLFKLKKAALIIIPLITIIKNLLMSILGYIVLLALSLLLHALLYFQASITQIRIDIPIIVFFVVINIARIITLNTNNIGHNAYNISNLHQRFHIDNKELAIYYQLFEPLKDYLFSIITMSLFRSALDISLIQALLIVTLFSLTEVCFSTLNFYLNNKKERTNTWIGLLSFALIIVLSTLLSIKMDILNPILLTIIIIIELLFIPKIIKYIKSYDNYNDYLNKKLNVIVAIGGKSSVLIELKESDITYEEHNLSGYKMLNKIFFKRHFRLIVKPIIHKTYFLLILAATIIIAMLFFKNQISSFGKNISDILLLILPILCYIIYYDSKTTMSMYYNCDNSLLNYQFYRQPKAILTLFTHRYFSILKLISLPFMMINMIIIELFLYKLINTTYLINLIGFNFITYIFFSFFSLLIYYLLQPYSDEKGITNPIYYMINTIIYLAFIYGNRIFNTPNKLVFGYGIICLPLIIIGIISLYSIGHKTFKKQN